jgi:hypothetical protein
MRQRCYRVSDDHHKKYRSRGTRVCARWRASFVAFLADMGTRPSSGHSLDRIDNRGHYSCGKCDECHANGWPANCRWATLREQARNKSTNRLLTIDGETMCLVAWAERYDAPPNRVRERIRLGWPLKEALTLPRWTVLRRKG